MTESSYVLDTNVLSKLLKNPPPPLVARIRVAQDSTMLVSEAIVYEVERGLHKIGATRQLKRFREQILPNFTVIPVDIMQWRATAELWADASNRGRAISDVDLLLIALAIRFDAIIVTVDGDFSAFPSIPVENWLLSS